MALTIGQMKVAAFQQCGRKGTQAAKNLRRNTIKLETTQAQQQNTLPQIVKYLQNKLAMIKSK